MTESSTPAAVPAQPLAAEHVSAIVQGAVSAVLHAGRSEVRAELAGHPFSTVLVALAIGFTFGIALGVAIALHL